MAVLQRFQAKALKLEDASEGGLKGPPSKGGHLCGSRFESTLWSLWIDSRTNYKSVLVVDKKIKSSGTESVHRQS